jgi:hypothetical protein
MSELKCDPISPVENRVVVRGDLSPSRKGFVGSHRGNVNATRNARQVRKERSAAPPSLAYRAWVLAIAALHDPQFAFLVQLQQVVFVDVGVGSRTCLNSTPEPI